jgi:hypothetical protein
VKTCDVQADILDAHKNQLRMLLSGNAGIDYERRALLRLIGSTPVAEALPNTTKWLQAAHTTILASSGQALNRLAASQVQAYVLQGFLNIAASNVAFTPATCPETLLLDLQRVFAMQNEVQRLSLIAAVQVISLQILREQGLSMNLTQVHQEWLGTLKRRLSVCMGDDSANMESLVAEVVSLLEKRCELSGLTLSRDAQELAAGMVRRTVSADDTVYKFSAKTVMAALKVALSVRELDDVKAQLVPVNGQLLAEVVLALAGAIRPVLDLNVQVHEPSYTAIIHGLLLDRPQSSSDAHPV